MPRSIRRNRDQRLPLMLAVVAVFLTTWAGSSWAVAAIEMAPLGVTPDVGQTFVVTVTANAEIPPLGCYALTLDYDPAVIDLVDATEGALFASSPDPTFFGVETDLSNRDVVSNCVLGFGTSVTPPGELAVLTFQALTEGATTISVFDCVLRDVDRAQIPGVGTQTVSVLVGATATPLAAGPLRIVAEPNPSVSAVQLRLSGVASGFAGAELRIVDLAGRQVRRLMLAPDSPLVVWDGRDGTGRRVGSGLYFAVLRQGGIAATSKLVRLD